jgi:hypothetical protein
MKRPDEHPFAIGQNVRHAKFGEGVVLNFEGAGLRRARAGALPRRGHQVARPPVRQAHRRVKEQLGSDPSCEIHAAGV